MSKQLDKSIFFYGAGNMAEGIIGGMVRKQAARPDDIWVYNRTLPRLEQLNKAYGVRPVKDLEQGLAGAGIIFVAVRPQDAAAVFPNIKKYASPEALVISICAGITIAQMEAALGAERRVCKVMPNVLIESGHGYSAVTPNANVNQADKADLETLLNSIGQTMFVPEDMFDPFTAFSCAGPAYVMFCIMALIDAGVQSGFSRGEARRIVLENCLGSALTLLNSDKHPFQVTDAMTSPAGVTIEGMHELASSGLHGTLMSCVRRAVERARSFS